MTELLKSSLLAAVLMCAVAGTTLAGEYAEREIKFFSKDAQLAGTLCLPKSQGPHAVVVLVPEFGPVDRDASWGKANGTFSEIAHHLASAGIGSLRYDPRGVPKSGGYYLNSGLFEFGLDAANALNFLKTLKKDVDGERLVVLGHGYGAKAAIIGASRTPGIAGVILLAGVYDKEPEHRRKIMRFQLEADGTPAAEADKILDQHRYFVDAIASGRYLLYEDYFLDPALTDWIVQAMKMNPEPPAWWRDNLLFDSAAAAARLTCPLVMVHAENDYLVETREASAAHKAIRKAGKSDVELKTFPGLTHRFIRADSRKDAYQFEKATVMARTDAVHPVDPAVLNFLDGWIKAKAKGPKTGQ